MSYNTPWTSGLSNLGALFSLGHNALHGTVRILWGFALDLLCFLPEESQSVRFGPGFQRAPSLLSTCLHPSLGASGLVSPSLSAPASLSLTNFVFPPVSPSLPCAKSLPSSLPLLCSPGASPNSAPSLWDWRQLGSGEGGCLPLRGPPHGQPYRLGASSEDGRHQ